MFSPVSQLCQSLLMSMSSVFRHTTYNSSWSIFYEFSYDSFRISTVIVKSVGCSLFKDIKILETIRSEEVGIWEVFGGYFRGIWESIKRSV